jgi:hypothetical protein
MDEDEKDIRNAIENPKYKPQRVAPRKASTTLCLIEPLSISVSSKELDSQSTLIYISIKNDHPKNDLLLHSVNLTMNTTVRDFDGDANKIVRDQKEIIINFKQSEFFSNEDDQSVSTDECNVEEYLRIIRADRFFHVTSIKQKSNISNSLSKGTISSRSRNEFIHSPDSYDSSIDPLGILRIKSGCSHKFVYKIIAKDTSNLIIGNFLTPLDIRYIDVSEKDEIEEPVDIVDIHDYISMITKTCADSTKNKPKINRQGSQLSSSSQVVWSFGTNYLNKSIFDKDIHVYNLDNITQKFNADHYHNLPKSPGYKQVDYF